MADDKPEQKYRLVSKTRPIREIRFGGPEKLPIRYSRQAVREGARPISRWFAHPNDPRWDEPLLCNHKYRAASSIGSVS